MLFGQSIFQSVLDRLESEEEAQESAEGSVGHRIHGLNASFVAGVREGVSAPFSRADQAYADNFGSELPLFEETPEPVPVIEETPEPEPQPIPHHLLRTRPQDVAEELSISARDTPQTLGDKRRAFAKANHPDRVDPLYRDSATIRMKIANLLIDEALRRLAIMAKLSR